MDSDLVPSFLSREDHDSSMQEIERSQAAEEEAFQKGYQLAMFDMERQMSLRNREVPITENRKVVPITSVGNQKNGVPLKNQSKVPPELKAKEKALFAENLRNPIAKAAEKESILRTIANKIISQKAMMNILKLLRCLQQFPE